MTEEAKIEVPPTRPIFTEEESTSKKKEESGARTSISEAAKRIRSPKEAASDTRESNNRDDWRVQKISINTRYQHNSR